LVVLQNDNLRPCFDLADDAIRRGGGQALNESIRAGAFEAFIAAMLVNQGPEKTQTVVTGLFNEEIRNSKPIMSWKNKLQQYIQEQEKTARVQEIIRYQTCREKGTPDHAARHTSLVSVRVAGKPWDPCGTGHGRKGKDAEMAAAKEAFETHCKK
jgi:dsRNA-specific ribonuclease